MVALWNATDGVYATHEVFDSEEEALAYADEFRKRYELQGFYRTAGGLRIPPEAVELEVVPAEP